MRIEEITKKDLESILSAIMSVYESGIDICELSEDMKSKTPINKKTKEAYDTVVAGNIALLSRQLFSIDENDTNDVSAKVIAILQDDSKDKAQIRSKILTYLLGVQYDALTSQLADINTRAKDMSDTLHRLSNDIYAIPH